MDTALSVQGLSKRYGDLRAVDDLSFDVRRGEVFGLLGPNGAGKTTAIHMICGLLCPDAGEVWIDGRPLREGRDSRSALGFCPQELVIWDSLTCLEQLRFAGQFYDLERREAKRRARRLLSALGLEDRSHVLACRLSGGMKRRLNIALSLVHDPAILILDEPQAGLDPQSRILVRSFIRSLEQSTTVILTTHDMAEADLLADRIAIIDQGRLLVLDSPSELKIRIGAGEVIELSVIGGRDDAMAKLKADLPDDLRDLSSDEGALRLVGRDIVRALPALLLEVQRHDLRIEDLRLRRQTLEDVFIALTGRRLRE